MNEELSNIVFIRPPAVSIFFRTIFVHIPFVTDCSYSLPVSVAARSKAYVYGRMPAEIVGSNPTGGMDVCLL